MADIISETGMPNLLAEMEQQREEEENEAVMREIFREEIETPKQPSETVPQYAAEQFHAALQEIKENTNKLEEIRESTSKLEKIRENTGKLEEIREDINKLEDRIGAMESQLKQIFNDMKKSQQNQNAVSAQTKLLIDRVSEINDRLHEENQKLKNDMYGEMIKPILLEFCGINTELSRDINRNRSKGNIEEAGRLQEFRDTIVRTALEHVGVEVYEPEVGKDFDAKLHRVVKSLPTEDDSLHRKIESIVNQGYLWSKNGQMQVLVPCRVNVYNKEN